MNIKGIMQRVGTVFVREHGEPMAKNDTESGPATSMRGLMTVQAVTTLISALTKVPEVDEILLKAGITRASLKRLETDDEIFSALRTRREALLATPWRIENASDADREFLTEVLTPHIDGIITGAWQAMPYGYSVLERVYEQREDKRYGFQSVLLKPMEWFDPQRDGTLKYFKDSGADASGEIVDLKYKFLLTQHEASYTNPKGEALMSRLYWPWLFRYNGWQFWAQFLERYGQPMMVGKGADTTKMAAALAKAVQDGCIAVGKEDEVEELEPSSNGEAFQIADAVVVKRIQKLILGQTLTSDSGSTDGKGSGSFALGKVHARVAETLRNADIRLVLGTLQNTVSALCAINGLDKNIKFVFADEDDLGAARADRDDKLVKQGVRFKKSYYKDTYKLEEADFEVVDPTPAPAPQDPDTKKSGLKKEEKEREKENKALKVSMFANDGSEDMQTLIDKEVMSILDELESPIKASDIKAVVEASTNQNELEINMGKLLERNNSKRFQTYMSAGMFYADVVGYVEAEEANNKGEE